MQKQSMYSHSRFTCVVFVLKFFQNFQRSNAFSFILKVFMYDEKVYNFYGFLFGSVIKNFMKGSMQCYSVLWYDCYLFLLN